MAEKRPAKPGGLSSREKEPAALPPTGSTTASRFRTTGSSGQRLIRSERQSSSNSDDSRLQVSEANEATVKNAGRRHTQNVQVIPEPKAVLVSPAHSKTERISKPPAPPPTSADAPGTKMSSVQIRVGSTRPGRAERVTSPSDGEESKKRQVSLSPPMSPPLSPTVDDTTVKHKPPPSSRYKPLPDQAFPSGATGTSATKGSSKSSAKGTTGLSANKPSPLDLKTPSSPSAQHLSLPSPSSTTSSGNLSSGGIFSEGLSSGEHMIAQAHSLDGRARVVGGAGLGKSSLDINPRNYKPTKEHHQPGIATEGADAPRVSTQASDGPSEDASAENEQCRDKMLLATNSIGMSTCGRPVLKSSVSDETGALNGRLQYDSKVKDLKARMSQLEATNSELKERNSVLEQQLNDHPPASDSHEGDSFEQGYTHRQEFDRLIGEVNRLTPFEGEVSRLKKEIKVLDERYQQAKGLEAQLIEQVSIVSLKEAEIATLNQQIHAGYDPRGDSKGGRETLSAEIAKLTAELDSKNHENARLKARLKKSRSTEYDSASADPSISVDAIRADYEQKLKDQETVITSLRKQGMQEAAAGLPVVPPSLRDTVAVSSGTSKEHSLEQHPGGKSSAASKSSTSYEERELAVVDEASQEVIKSLVRTVTERDRRIKMLSDQLQDFMQTASNVEKIRRHAKEQSEEILRLKDQLQAGHEDSASRPHSHSSEHDALLLKHEESLQTIRRFNMQLKKLEEENKRLKAEAHDYANTKLDDVEKDNKSLREEVVKCKTKIAAMNVKLNELITQKKACEEKNLVMHHTLKSLESTKHDLEQKDIAQQALLQNLRQDLERTKERASERAVMVEKCETEIHDQCKQIQDLLGEIQAAKAMAGIYEDDFKKERKDRENAHAQKIELEERFDAEVTRLKEQVQRVSADNGRLSKQMKDKEAQMKSEINSLKQQIQEKSRNYDTLKAEGVVLQDEMQSKAQQVKQYKKQIDQLKSETDRHRQDMTAFLQQAEHHKQQIESTVKEKEHFAQQSRLLQGETEQLHKEINILKAREHLAHHGVLPQRQASVQSSPISVEEFMKERGKYDDAIRMVRRLEKQVDDLQTEKVVLISENEELQRRLSQNQPKAGRSHPPGVSDGRKPVAHSDYRAQGGSALPNLMRPMVTQQRLSPAMKSASVDSQDILNPRGHFDLPPNHSRAPTSSSNPGAQPPIHGNHQRPMQQRHQNRRSLTSTIETPQRDSPFPAAYSNAQVPYGAGGGYPFASTDDINIKSNADASGGRGLQPVMGSPPTNAKLPPPPRSIANAAKSASSSGYAHRQPPPVLQQQRNQPQYGQHSTRQAPPTYSQSSGGGSSGVPPFMAHAHGQSVQSHGPMRATSAASVQQQHYIDLARQQHISPPPDEGSGHQSLPSFGSGSFTEQADRVLSPDLVPRPSRDDTYLPKQQRQVPPELQPRYHPAFDVIEKDSSPPTSMGPVMHAGQPLSLNPQAVNQGLSAPPPRHQRRSHQMPLSPEHSKLRMDFSGIDRSRIVRPDCSEPSSKNGRSAMQANRQQPAVRGPVQVSSKGSTHNRPAPAVYVYGGGNAPELDSDPASQVSFESGCGSPIGGSQVNLNENTLERGIDRDIRRAASNVKKEIGGQSASAGAKGRSDMAPYDPNLVCPSCGEKFRIGEIQKFKRHASTCTGT